MAPDDAPDVRLRRFEAADAERVYEAAIESRADLAPWMPWCHPDYTLEEARAYVLTRGPAFDEGLEYAFAIVGEDGRHLGTCELNQIDANYRRANLGYWVRSSAAGRGVAPAAVRLLARFAWMETDLQRLEIVCAVGNTRSQRVAEKAGALREGVARDRLILYGRPHDAVIFSLVRGRLYILCGLAFAGKTTLCKRLVERRGLACVSLDAINEERGAGFGGDGLPPEEWGRTLALAEQRVEALLAAGANVVVDDTACFRWIRDRWRAIAASHGCLPILVHLDPGVEVIRSRIAAAAAAAAEGGDRRLLREEVWVRHLAQFEAPGPDERPITVGEGDEPGL